MIVLIGKLFSLCTHLMGALRAIRHSRNCEACTQIVEDAEKEYFKTMEEAIPSFNTKEEAHGNNQTQ